MSEHATSALADSQYLHFEELPAISKTRRFVVQAIRSGGHLGDIRWFGRWRQYCFFPQPDTVFNAGCLNDINDRLVHLNTIQRKSRATGSLGTNHE